MEFVHCGFNFSVCLGSMGVLWASGNNLQGQLGSGDYEPRYVFKEVGSFALITQISCGRLHTVCLDESGKVWAFGDNSKCQLGVTALDGVHSRCIPELVPIEAEITEICCGLDHTLCLDTNLECWSFGDNSYGQLGYSLRRSASYWHYDQKYDLEAAAPQVIPGAKEIRLLACSNHSVLVDQTSSELRMFGDNSQQQFGVDTSHKQHKFTFLNLSHIGYITKVVCNASATLLLNEEGQVYMAGTASISLQYPEFTHLEALVGVQHISAGEFFFTCIDDMGKLWTISDSDGTGSGELRIVEEIDTVISTSRGGSHVFALDRSGTVWAFGPNEDGQLGMGFAKLKKNVPPTKLSAKASQCLAGRRTRLKSARK